MAVISWRLDLFRASVTLTGRRDRLCRRLACVDDLVVRPIVRLEEVDPVAMQLLTAIAE
jgi:hypothetical protein